MKRAYEFVTGNSTVTPIGAAVAILLALLFHSCAWAPYAFVAVLLVTLAGSVFERVH